MSTTPPRTDRAPRSRLRPSPAAARRLAGAATVALAFWLAASPAAARRERFSAGPWAGWAYYSAEGRFLHCALSRLYPNGIRLIFARTATGAFTVSFMGEGLRLREGGRYRITLGIDRTWRRDVVAASPRARLLLVPLPAGPEMIHRLRRGRALTVDDGWTRRTFALEGTYWALPTLERCATARGAAAPIRGVPKAGSGSRRNPR